MNFFPLVTRILAYFIGPLVKLLQVSSSLTNLGGLFFNLTLKFLRDMNDNQPFQSRGERDGVGGWGIVDEGGNLQICTFRRNLRDGNNFRYAA